VRLYGTGPAAAFRAPWVARGSGKLPVFELRVTDDSGDTATDRVRVIARR